jgi:DNA repair exonuclease SbcCD ATPase subunit
MEKDALEAQKKMDNLANKFRQQGQTAGKGFAGGMKQGFDNIDTAAAKLGRNIGKSLAPQMIALQMGIKVFQSIGNAIGGAFMANEKFAKGISDLKASLGESFASVVKPVSDFFGNIIGKMTESAAKARETKEALKQIKSELADMQKETAIAVRSINTGVDKGLMTEFEGANAKALEYRKNLETLIDKKSQLESNRGTEEGRRAYADIEADIRNTAKAIVDLNFYIVDSLRVQEELSKNINSAEKERLKSAQIEEELANKTTELEGKSNEEKLKINKEKLEIQGNYVASLEKEKNNLDQIIAESEEILRYKTGTTAEEIAAINAAKARLEAAKITRDYVSATLTVQKETLKTIEAEVKAENKADAIDKARLAAVEKYEQAVRKAYDAYKAGLIDINELEKQKEAARAAEYADFEAIVAQYKLTTGEIVKQRDELAEEVKLRKFRKEIDDTMLAQEEEITRQLIAQKTAQAQNVKTEDEKNRLLDEAVGLEKDLIDKQRQRAREALEQSAMFIAASDEERAKILENFDAITEGMKKSIEKTGDGSGTGSNNWLANAMGLTDEKLGHMMQVGDAAIGAFQNISDAMLEISRKAAEEQIAEIDRVLKEQLDAIEEAREAKLIAAGFEVENNAESLEAQLEAAKRTGDEVLIYQTERRLEEQRINDEFDAQAKEATEKAAKEKAQIEFNLAKEEYSSNMIKAVNAGVMAVLQALAAAPPPYNFILAGLSGAATAVQIGLLAANPPKPPKFANSGIVPGNKYSGDRVNALVDSGELILNRAHQDNIASQLTNSSGPISATIFVMLDSREIAQRTVELVNNGEYILTARAQE